ncbi:MAG: hypothetical protein FWE31_05655 [Firmicutes bacterium]|nr:hypothetical protein [Bacillota bacterium]
MRKFPYIVEYKLGQGQVEFKDAEKLLDEYQDFYISNQVKYREIFKKFEQADGEDDEKLIELRRLKAEQHAKEATDHWAKLFGSLDLAEVTLLGLEISWDDLQAILEEEFRAKTHPMDSAMGTIAPLLRQLASVLLFAHRLDEKGVESDIVDRWLDKLEKGEELRIPEYSSVKKKVNKLKPEALLEFVEGI